MTIHVIVFFVGIIIMYYSMLYNADRKNIIHEGELTAKDAADQVDKYLSTNIDSVKLAAYTLDEMLEERRTDEEIQDFLVGQSTAIRSAVLENSTGLYGYINGRFFSGTGWEPPEGYDATARPWYTRAMEGAGELTILDPYIDVQTGNTMLALGKTLKDDVSVISVDVSLDQIQKLTEDAVTSGNSDIEMILNDESVVVAHSDTGEIGKNYGNEKDTVGAILAEKLKDQDSSNFEFVYEGKHYIVYAEEIRNGWHCVSVKDATGVFRSLLLMLAATIAFVLATVLLVGVIMARSNRYLRMSARAVAANEAKSTFLSNMSHEIRTPINAVLGMNEMILRETQERNTRSYAENIRTAGRNLLSLVNDILDFSKIEAGKIEIIPVEYDLSSVINDLVNMTQARVDEKGLKLNLDIDEQIPKLLFGDEIRIKQVVTNILTNAVKYTEEGSVSLSITHERPEDDPDHILLSVFVRDTGIGIKEEDMQKLFTQFERIEQERNRNIEGAGLGMSITKTLLDMMGSTLEVDSVYGHGSIFGFTLLQEVVKWEPIGDYRKAYLAHVDGREKYKEKFAAPQARVLVVDDYAMNVVVFESLLKTTGVKIDSATNGDEGIDLSCQTKYDMIFLDHMMPGKDGIRTLHEMQAIEGCPNSDTPMICLTANAISGAREKYLAEGFDDYLTKPVSPEALEEMMIKYLPAEKVIRYREKESGQERLFDEQTGAMLEHLEKGMIDAEAGMKNSGSADSYLSLLKVFYESIDEKAKELQRFIEEKDYKNYTIKVHALKSSARIIGATDLGEKAMKLEEAGKEDNINYILSHHEGFLSEFVSFEELLSPLFEKGEAEDDRPVADEDLMEGVFSEIRSAAEEMDCDRLEGIFDEMEDYRIPESGKELYEKVKDEVGRFDYDAVLELLADER
ncbi:MAG: response regulator [Lachnospiraceae bacterium]|nr:response regulator [Lachnospiraceae bacterium]